MPIHLPIMLIVKGARRGVAALDEATAVGDPSYFDRCNNKHFIPKLPYVLANTGKKVFGSGPRLTPDEEAEWRQQAASVREAAAAEAAAAREQKRQEKAAQKEAKQAEKAAKASAKSAKKQEKAAAKAEAKGRKEAAKAARRQQV